MTNIVEFTLNGKTVRGEKHAEIEDLSLVLIETRYYVLKDGAVITKRWGDEHSSWGNVHNHFMHSLPPIWKKKVKGLSPKIDLSLDDALTVLRLFVEDVKRRAGCSVLSAGLFGSRARGDQRIDSDYDVLLILDKKLEGKARDILFDIALEFSEASDMDIAPTIYFVGDYDRRKQKDNSEIENMERDIISL